MTRFFAGILVFVSLLLTTFSAQAASVSQTSTIPWVINMVNGPTLHCTATVTTTMNYDTDGNGRVIMSSIWYSTSTTITDCTQAIIIADGSYTVNSANQITAITINGCSYSSQTDGDYCNYVNSSTFANAVINDSNQMLSVLLN